MRLSRAHAPHERRDGTCARPIASEHGEITLNQSRSSARFHGRAEEWVTKLPTPLGERFICAFEHGSLAIELYAPRGIDPQMPHDRDEVYVVVRGTGFFVNGPERHAFGPGDLLFVPAGVLHRFEDFTDDLAVWVVFYGPEGGEATQADRV
jgi:mannose-6-phosphate isomerase-like protein (cupin superfamily)